MHSYSRGSGARRITTGASIAAAAMLLAGCGPTAFQGQSALMVAGDLPPPPPPPPKEEPPARVEIRDNKIVIHEKIQFEYAKSRILEASHSLLNEVADVIKKHPRIKKVAIEGHASSEGDAEFNRRLSDARAKAVMEYLVSQSVEQARLTAQGFGADRPIAENETEAGREKNRRVEFNIVEQDFTTTKVEVDPATGKERVIEESGNQK